MCVAIAFALVFFPDVLISHRVNTLYKEGKLRSAVRNLDGSYCLMEMRAAGMTACQRTAAGQEK